MEISEFDSVICLDDKWTDIKRYKVKKKTKNEMYLSDKTTPMESFSDSYTRIVKREDFHRYFPMPSFFNVGGTQIDRVWHEKIRDMAAVETKGSNGIEVSDLIDRISSRLGSTEDKDAIEWVLRLCVRAETFEVSVSKRDHQELIFIKHSKDMALRERTREFAAGIGSELKALSDRVKLIIGHSTTVGTYREQLLQSVLRRHLPERYHVANGFIFGVDRQIDILIYDRVDHAPLFREGDLVVVPVEAVRAVIEVKTTVDSKALRKSLELLSDVSACDGEKPFFKGVFGFYAELSDESIVNTIKNYYRYDPAEFSGYHDGRSIGAPFAHLSCLCVLDRIFAFVGYDRNERDRLVPYLYTKTSRLDLNSQASHFTQLLLAHLGIETNRLTSDSYFMAMLGQDTVTDKHDVLVSDDSWGAYFNEDEGNTESPECDVREMEEFIMANQKRIFLSA